MTTLVKVSGRGVKRGKLGAGDKVGAWRIESELGRGGMGVVYAVVHERIGKRAALKLMNCKDQAEHGELEASVVNLIGHPGTVDIFEIGTLEDGRSYLVMERVEGVCLRTMAAEKLVPDTATGILLAAARTLAAAHDAGVVHRDLKPEHIHVLGTGPDGWRIKVLDWGVAKQFELRQTIEGVVIGTPRYLSPEQACGQRVTPKCDVYALGVIAYELYLERLPFDHDRITQIMRMQVEQLPPPPRGIWPEVPPSIEALLDRMLAKDPAERPTMHGVVELLERIAVELRTQRPPTHKRTPPRPTQPGQTTTAFTVDQRPRKPQAAPPPASRSRLTWRIGGVLGAFAVGAAAVALVVGGPGTSGSPATAVAVALPAAAAAPAPTPTPGAAMIAADPAPSRSTRRPRVTVRPRPRVAVSEAPRPHAAPASVPAVAVPMHVEPPPARREISTDALVRQYRHVGEQLNALKSPALWSRYRRIQIQDASSTPAARLAASQQLDEIERLAAQPR